MILLNESLLDLLMFFREVLLLAFPMEAIEPSLASGSSWEMSSLENFLYSLFHLMLHLILLKESPLNWLLCLESCFA